MIIDKTSAIVAWALAAHGETQRPDAGREMRPKDLGGLEPGVNDCGVAIPARL